MRAAIPFIFLSPITKRSPDGEIESADWTVLDVELYARQIEHIFNYNHVNVHERAVRQIAGTCPLDKSKANALEIPYVRCCNHKLALDVKKVPLIPLIGRTVDDVRQSMCEWKGSEKQSYGTKINKLFAFDTVCDEKEQCLFDDE